MALSAPLGVNLDGREAALASLDDVDHRITILGEAVHESVQRIEKLFAVATAIETADGLKLRAAQETRHAVVLMAVGPLLTGVVQEALSDILPDRLPAVEADRIDRCSQ